MNTERTEKFVNAIACDLEEGGFRQVSGTTLRRTLATAVTAALPLLEAGNPVPGLSEQQGVDGYDKLADLIARLYMARDMERAGAWSYLFAEAADALAATGKHQVGENPAWRDELVREAHARGLMEGLNHPRRRQAIEVQQPEYIRDVHDVEQGLIRNPDYVPAKQVGEVQGDALREVADKLRRAGARLPAPPVTGTVEGSMVTGLSIALALVEDALAATGKQQVGDVQGDESPMAKMAAALRGKAEAEKAAFDQRVQSGEWGPMPDARTQADFCQLCDGSGWDGESREKKCQSCSGEGLAARQPEAWQQRTRFCNSNGEWSEWAPFDPRHGFPERVGKNEQSHDAEYRPLFLGPTAQGIDLAQQFREFVADCAANSNDVHIPTVRSERAIKLLAMIDQRDAAPGVG